MCQQQPTTTVHVLNQCVGIPLGGRTTVHTDWDDPAHPATHLRFASGVEFVITDPDQAADIGAAFFRASAWQGTQRLRAEVTS